MYMHTFLSFSSLSHFLLPFCSRSLAFFFTRTRQKNRGYLESTKRPTSRTHCTAGDKKEALKYTTNDENKRVDAPATSETLCATYDVGHEFAVMGWFYASEKPTNNTGVFILVCVAVCAAVRVAVCCMCRSMCCTRLPVEVNVACCRDSLEPSC